jgi:hypothetical protein
LPRAQSALDEREQLPFLEPHVRREQEPELVEVTELAGTTVPESADPVADGDVITQRTGDERVVGIPTRCEGGEKDLLL